jgi:BioD-like phosphotransacetylase family protein
VAASLDAKALLVLRYKVDLLDGAVAAAQALDHSLAGVIVNAVPPSQLAKARGSLAQSLESEGVRVLGIVPQDRVLLGVTVREMAQRLRAKVACAEESLDELVERLMIGAMSVEGALVYFRKHPNKAVVTGGDRPDVQLAALATPTRCLVLTGGFEVDPRVLARARTTGVPVLVTERDTLAAVEAVHDLFNNSRFHQKAKLDRLESLVADHVDAKGLRQVLEG